MFLDLAPAGPDPILSSAAAFDSDPASCKVDLGIGVYRDGNGRSSVLASVKRAEQILVDRQDTKAYLSSEGLPAFNAAQQTLLFGKPGAVIAHGRVRTVQTPGGSGALRIAAELIRRCNPHAAVWVPAPTWANHVPILQAGGLQVRHYRYYDPRSHVLTFEEMQATLQNAAAGDVVLMHGCCHNPTGADPDMQQWHELAALFARKKLLPLIDIAYQGFACGIAEDVQAIRLLCATLPEMLVVSSCSKNFGLYRERTGALSVVGSHAAQAQAAHGNVLQIVRSMYSMPPDHGAAVVACILQEEDLRELWMNEVRAMRERINTMRVQLAALLQGVGDFDYLRTQSGMFSMLDLSAQEVERLRTQFHVYLVGSGRVNLAALSAASVPYVAQAIGAVLRSRHP